MVSTERTTAHIAIQRVRGRVYEVASQTDRHVVYEYDLDTHTCSCKAGQEGRYCWHWGAAKEADDFYRHWHACHGRDPHGCIFDPAMIVAGGADGLQSLFE